MSVTAIPGGASCPALSPLAMMALRVMVLVKYGVSGEEKLRSLIESVGAEVGRLKPGGGKELSPHWKVPDGPQAAASDKLPRWVVLTCWGIVALALVVYLGLFFKIRHDAGVLREDIQKQSAELGGGPKIGFCNPAAVSETGPADC